MMRECFSGSVLAVGERFFVALVGVMVSTAGICLEIIADIKDITVHIQQRMALYLR
jgi:hypothetical protein